MRILLIFVASAALAACASQRVSSDIPRGAAAYELFPAKTQAFAAADYRIGPLDTIDVTVFQEPDLSTKGTAVDASGKVTLPLIGSVTAANKTATELAKEIADRLGQKYLVDPEVSVVVAGSVSQKVTVQGEVTEPGVYEIRGPTTLLESLAMAKGETQIAALREVVVFRTIADQRQAAVFDVASIRRGEAPDPQILGNDVVVVGYSSARSLWRDIVSAAPLFNVFRPLGY